MKTINIDTDKISFFSDLHFGKSRDSLIKLKIADNFVDKLIEILKKRRIEELFFLGDWFDNRSSISVKTYNHGYNALKRIASERIKLYMVIGNHDSYFKENISVNSIEPLKEIDGLVLIDEVTKIHFTKNDKYGLVCPWGMEEDLFKIKEKFDLLFGHFEFSGAQQNYSNYLSKSYYNGEDLTKISPLIFSGHFHIRKEYNFKNGKIICIGCPFELDWGDYNNEKGLYFLNLKNSKYSFLENNYSPKHIKLYWSKIKRKIEDFSHISGNYIKLVVDEEYQFEKIMKLVNAINLKNPIKPCETEFLYNTNFNLIEDLGYSEEEAVTMSKIDYLLQFIDKTPKEQIRKLNLDKLKILSKKYFEQASQKISDE